MSKVIEQVKEYCEMEYKNSLSWVESEYCGDKVEAMLLGRNRAFGALCFVQYMKFNEELNEWWNDYMLDKFNDKMKELAQ